MFFFISFHCLLDGSGDSWPMQAHVGLIGWKQSLLNADHRGWGRGGGGFPRQFSVMT